MIKHWRWTGLVVALVAACPALASADEGLPNQETLKAMGLSGMQVMSDEAGLEVRGMGFTGGDGYLLGLAGYQSSHAGARGRSHASVSLDGQTTDSDADAGSHNSYKANGAYEASGNNFSEATLSKTDVHQVIFTDGTSNTDTMIHTIHVEAGGFSGAKAFGKTYAPVLVAAPVRM